MEQTEKLLKDYSDAEKGAYLGAIASIATADHEAAEEEIEYITELANSADLSPGQQEAVIRAARELPGDELKQCLDILKQSDLRFSLVTDLISFAEADKNYSEQEKKNVENIAQYLNINQQQYSLLDQFVKKTNETGRSGEELSQQGFFGSLGLEDKFKSAGINMSSLTKGLIGIAGPIILSKLLTGGMRRRNSGGLNPFNQGLGGGIGGGFGGGSSGLGSIISMLNGGRGFGSTGGLLSRILRR